MEGNVWTQWFVQAVSFVSSLFASMINPRNQTNGGASSNVPGNVADITSTSLNATNPLLVVKRNPDLTTTDGLFGYLEINGQQVCYTMERKAVAIPVGTYPAQKRYSPHFETTVIGIEVPNRTDIEIHWANYPSQLEGCIAVGENIDNGALDNSKAAFCRVMAAVPNEFTVQIS